MEINYYKPCPEYDRCCELIDRYWEAGEYEACFKGHLELAEQGYPLAECQVGWFYLKGQGVPQDDANAFYWTKRAAEHGDWDAQYNLGTFYEAGIGTARDAEQAKRWYIAAARQGQDEALENAVLKGFHGNRLTHRCDSARRLPHRPAASEALHRKRTATDAYRLPLRKGRRLFCRFRLFCRRETCGIFRFPSWQ